MGKNKADNLSQISLFILDKSGSMDAIRQQAISGFNEYIQTLQKGKINQDFSLVLFDTMSVERPYNHVSIKKVEPLSETTYKPMGGTPLYDACVDVIEDLNKYVKDRKDKISVSVVIMTDGEENSSTRHDQKCLRDLVDKLTQQGNWTFAYMGANQDAWANAASLGILAGNIAAWVLTASGTVQAFRDLSSATLNYCASTDKGIAQSRSFFGANKTGKGGDI